VRPTYIHEDDPDWTTQDSGGVFRSCWRCRPWSLIWHCMEMRHDLELLAVSPVVTNMAPHEDAA